MNTKHILLVPSWYPESAESLYGTFFREQARSLQRAGNKVGVLSVQIKALRDQLKLGGSCLPWGRTSISHEQGVTVYRLSVCLPGRFVSLCNWVNKWLLYSVYKKYCKKEGGPDVLHAHCVFQAGYLLAQLKKKITEPMVLTEHYSLVLSNRLSEEQRGIYRFCLSRMNLSIGVSEALANQMNKLGEEGSSTVLGNIVNVDDFSLAPTQKERPFVIGAVAFLTKNKRFDLLISAFAGSFRGEDAILRIAGDGCEREALEDLAVECGVEDQVEFSGELQRSEVKEMISQCHVIVSSSEVETFGITLIEAMACGKPVVSTDSGGPASFINEDTGILVPVNDVEAMVEALTRIRVEYRGFSPQKIRDYAVRNFSEEAVVQQLMVHYENVCQTR
jgi:L-malate glycosyltransferase